MIATDSLSLLFIACFLTGLLFFIVTALLGNLGHGTTHSVTHQSGVVHATGTHATHIASHGPTHATHIASHGPTHTTGQSAGSHGASQDSTQGHNQFLSSFVNPTAIMLFLLGFGFFGYLFHNTIQAVAALTLTLAGIGGVLIAALLLMLVGRLFGDSEGATVQDVSDRTGLLGKVSITIQENSLGEIIYVSPGGMRKSIPARSIDGRRLERAQEVVVVNYQHGIAEVDTWEHFISEDGTPSGASASDELDKLRTLLDESSQPPIHLTNDASASTATQSGEMQGVPATQSGEMQGVPATQSGEMQGKPDSQLVMRKELQKE